MQEDVIVHKAKIIASLITLLTTRELKLLELEMKREKLLIK
jgi:hypothetical protein